MTDAREVAADEEGCTCECYSDAAFCMKRCIYAGCNPAVRNILAEEDGR